MVDVFSLDLIMSILSMDLPRVNFFPILKGVKGNIFKLRESLCFKQGHKSVLCFDESFGSLKSVSGKFFVEVEKLLAPIGPLRRNDVEFEIAKNTLLELMNNDHNIVLMQVGLEEKDLGLSALLEEVSPSFKSLELKSYHRHFPQLQKEKLEQRALSASRLQQYIDCPKNYFFKFHMGFKESLEVATDILATEIGTLEHKLIGDIIEQKINDIESYVRDEFDKFCEKHQKLLESNTNRKYLIELLNTTYNGVNLVRQVIQFGGSHYEFEKGFNLEEGLLGFIDFYAHQDDNKIILDFKRSVSSIPAKSEVENREVIQLWFYLNALIKAGLVSLNDKICVGYINLKSIEESLVFCSDELSEHFSNAGVSKVYSIEKFNEEGLTEFCNIIDDFTENVYQKQYFPAAPRKKTSCQYCDMKMLCSRGED
jgi:hypothetical protein